MRKRTRQLSTCLILPLSIYVMAANSNRHYRTTEEIINASKPSEWQALDPNNTLLMEFNHAQVVIALAPEYAPAHVANIRTLAHEHYWDNTAIYRVQDNYVMQWGVPDGDEPGKNKPLGTAKTHLPSEFSTLRAALKISSMHDRDGWAPQTGFASNMPVASDPYSNRAWIPHCYGVVGASRDMAADSSTGESLYVVIGQPARRLDRNVSVVGRVVQGMEAISALPRGTDFLGTYKDPQQMTPIARVRLLADLPEQDRPNLETLRTDSGAFRELMESHRHTSKDWFVHSPEYASVCDIEIPFRKRQVGSTSQ